MVVEYIRYKIDLGRTEEFVDAYRRGGELLDASPHCLRWEAARSVDDPEKQVVRIEWDSAEGHIQSFRQSADLQAVPRRYGAVLPGHRGDDPLRSHRKRQLSYGQPARGTRPPPSTADARLSPRYLGVSCPKN
jgi:heme-degrading monooxygenase HmoA